MNSQNSQTQQLHVLHGEHLIEVLSDPAWIGGEDHSLQVVNPAFLQLFSSKEIQIAEQLIELTRGHKLPLQVITQLGDHVGSLSLMPCQDGAGRAGHLGIFKPDHQGSERLQKLHAALLQATHSQEMLDVLQNAFPQVEGCALVSREGFKTVTAGKPLPDPLPALNSVGLQFLDASTNLCLMAAPLPRQNAILHLMGTQKAQWNDIELLLLQSCVLLLSDALERTELRDAQQKLLQHQEETIARLQAILDNAPVGIGLRNTDLKIELVNRKAAEYNQQPSEQHRHRTMNELFPGAFERVERMLRQVLTTGEPLLDVELTDQDLPGFRAGHHWQLNYFPVKTRDGRTLGVGSIIQDITARKASEMALRDSQHFLQRVADTVPTLIYIYDVEQCKNIYFNSELKNILGYTPQEIEAMDQSLASSMIHPDELQSTVQHYQNLFTLGPGETLSREYRMRHKNGSWRWLYTRETIFTHDQQGRPRQFLGGAIDITDWKEAQQVIQESERRFQLVADRAPVMIWMADPQGNAIFHNQNWSEFTGRPPEQDLGMGWLDLMHPQDRALLMENFMDQDRRNQPFETEYRMRRHDGEFRWVVDRGTPRFSPDGQFRGFIGACIDIHDRKLAEEAIQQSEQKLRELSEAQKRFVADAAHELRTPLTSIQGNLDLFVRFPNIPEDEKKEILSDVQREATRLGRLVNDMLQLARGDAGATLRLDTIHLHQVVLDVWRDLERVSPNHAMRLLNVEDIEMLGDPDRLRQLVLILVENALKYTPRGGTVKLELRKSGDQAKLRVSDTGVGIGPEDLLRVFERFYRADRSRHRSEDPGGTGLGLPIAKWIVEQHGGEIHLESEIGKGTTVLVSIPIKTE